MNSWQLPKAMRLEACPDDQLELEICGKIYRVPKLVALKPFPTSR